MAEQSGDEARVPDALIARHPDATLALEPGVSLWIRSRGRHWVAHLEDGEHTLGKHPTNAICLPDATVSQFAGVFEIAGESVALRDVGSFAGFIVRGERHGDRCALSHGDDVQYGANSWLRVIVR